MSNQSVPTSDAARKSSARSTMDQELKARWVEALRSGRYKQGKNYLFEDGRYCCLGVLQKILTGKEPPLRWGGLDSIPEQMRFLEEHAKHLELLLANMNDGKGDFLGKGQTFAEIADYIENHL